MILAAVIWWIVASRLPGHEALWRYPDGAGKAAPVQPDGEAREAARAAARKSRRKLRKKLR
jgi:hypothetical protein